MKFNKSFETPCKDCKKNIHMTQLIPEGRWLPLRADPKAIKEGSDLKEQKLFHSCEDTIAVELPKATARPPITALEVDSGDYFMQQIHAELIRLNGYIAQIVERLKSE